MVNSGKIKKRAKDLGVRQKDIADRLGLQQSTVNLKINNQRPMTLDEAEAIADILGITNIEFAEYFFAKEVA